MPDWINSVDSTIDKAFELTQLPQLTGYGAGYVGRGFDALAGTNVAPTVERIGHDIPRMVAESLLTIPEVGSGAGIPVAAATWMNRLRKLGQIAGYGSSAVKGYAETGSPLGALISAGSLGLGNKLFLPAERAGLDVGLHGQNLAERLAGYAPREIVPEEGANLLSQNLLAAGEESALDPKTYLQRIMGSVGRGATDVGTGLGLSELSRQASMSVGPNAVGLDSPERNPFTAENVAGNVVNALPMAVGATLATRARFEPEQVRHLHEWINARKAAEQTSFGFDWEGPVTAEQYHDTFGTLEGAPAFRGQDLVPPEDMWTPEAVRGMTLDKAIPQTSADDVSRLALGLRSHLEVLKDQEARGELPGAEQTRQSIKSLLDGVNQTTTPEGRAAIGQTLKEFDTTARQLPPDDVQGFVKFVGDVNGLIDQINENTTSFTEEQKTKKAQGQTWHPAARSSLVTDRLQQKGLIEKVTPDWLKENFNAEFDQTGDPQFAYQVVLQKVANRLLDQVPKALETEKTLPTQVQTQTSPAVGKIDAFETRYIDALKQLPPEVSQEVLQRSVEIRRKPNTFVQGMMVNRETAWRNMVIRAMDSYDPESKTILVKKGGGYQRTSVRSLIARDENGNYILQPSTGTVKIGEGGKGSRKVGGKTVPEMNIQDLQRPGGVTPDEILDEDVFKQTLAEEGIGGSMAMKEGAGLGQGKAGEEAVPEVGVTSPDFLTTPEGKARSLSEVKDQLLKTLPTLSDDQLYSVAAPAFQRKSAPGTIPPRDPGELSRRKMFRPALMAALEDLKQPQGTPVGPNGKEFLRLRQEDGVQLIGGTEKQQLTQALAKFFGFQTPVSFEGAKAGLRPDEQRLALIVQRLTDPKVVESVKKFGKTSMMEGEGKTAPATYQGFQEGYGDIPGFHIYNLTEDIPGHPKGSTVTGETLKAKGFTVPPVGETLASGETSTMGDRFANTQPPGTFTSDVLRTFRDRFRTILGERGYSGSLRDLYTEMAVAIAQSAPEKMTDFYRVSGKEWGLAKPEEGRGKVGVNVDENVPQGQEIKYANRILATLAHEISHIDTYITQGLVDSPDAFSERRRVHRENLAAMAQTLSPQERESMLTTLKDGLIPKEYQTDIRDKATGLVYGAHDPEEFVATVNELIAASLLRGKQTGFKNGLEVLDYGPAEVREYANGTYRALHDVLTGMKQSLADPFIRQMAGKGVLPEVNRFVTSELFDSIVRTAREASILRDSDKALAQARSFVSSMSPGAATAPPLTSPAMWFRVAQDLDEGFRQAGLSPDTRLMPNAVEGLKDAQEFLSKRTYDKVHRPGIWASWFYPYANLMESMQRAGFPLARPMANLAMGVESAISRLRSGILEPFVIKGTDGQVHFDKDNALIQKISEERSGPWRTALNSVSSWQQEHSAQSMFVQGKDGQVVVNDQLEGAKDRWETIRRNLKPEDQQVVMAGSIALDRTSQNGANLLTAALNESNVHRTARLIMSMNRKMPYDQALDLGQKTVLAYQQGNELALSSLVPQSQRIALDSLLAGPDGLLAKFGEVAEKLGKRPGFRPESLPGDWVVRFQTPQNEIRYLSAETEHKANWLMRKLKGEGNTQAGEIVKKSELKDFTSFDDPDTLLRKFAETEQTAWSRVVNTIEQSFGPEVTDELRTYVPGGQAMKELAVKGMNQYLVERKNLIDRTRFDYIDGTMSWAGRLAASVAFRSTRQMKDLILADPRSRMFPSFERMTNDHFENMMSPTAQWSKELRTFSSAMMMGGSLASSVINASQSITSLVPILIQYDKNGIGPVGAWKAMTSAIADAAGITLSKDWQTRAKSALRVDPKDWTLQQAKDALYYRNVSDGGINHGIILDNIFSSTDQKTLMTAKFGHGDYGPTTVGEMARKPVYLASQLSLKPFGWVEQFNNKISLMAGIDQGYSQGLRGEQLYDHAKLVKTLSTYGGGKANAPGLVPKLSGPYTRSAVGVVNNLQQYGYGIVATYAQLLKDSLGNSPELSPLERRQSVKALGTMLATQLAVGGALGLPFAAAGLTVLEKVFGIPANQLVRQGLAGLASDPDQGAVIAETALNGIGNQMFGLDVSSRLGVSNLLGTSSYRGFNLQDMAGPTVSVVGNMVQALGLFGQNEPTKAMKALVPNSFKNLVDMSDTKAKYGDYGIRDQGGNLLYQPTPTQAAMYMMGFRPKEVSEKRQAQAMLTFANQRASQRRGQDLDTLSESLLQGDNQSALTFAHGLRYSDPTVDPHSVLRSIVSRAVDSVTQKDFLASGPSSNESERQGIAGTFGSGVVTRQSEVQRAMLGMQLGAGLGLSPDAKTLPRAALVDMLVQSKGMPRSQAVRLAEFVQ